MTKALHSSDRVRCNVGRWQLLGLVAMHHVVPVMVERKGVNGSGTAADPAFALTLSCMYLPNHPFGMYGPLMRCHLCTRQDIQSRKVQRSDCSGEPKVWMSLPAIEGEAFTMGWNTCNSLIMDDKIKHTHTCNSSCWFAVEGKPKQEMLGLRNPLSFFLVVRRTNPLNCLWISY